MHIVFCILWSLVVHCRTINLLLIITPHTKSWVWLITHALIPVNTLRLRQNDRHFADDILKCIFFNENAWIPIEISLKFVLPGVQLTISQQCPDNGLAPTRQQPITWTIGDLFIGAYTYASLDLNELKHFSKKALEFTYLILAYALNDLARYKAISTNKRSYIKHHERWQPLPSPSMVLYT